MTCIFRQEPHTLVKPSKSGSVDSEKVEKVKPTATRNLILIRHGQYNLKGTKDEERYLTALGKNLFLSFVAYRYSILPYRY